MGLKRKFLVIELKRILNYRHTVTRMTNRMHSPHTFEFKLSTVVTASRKGT